MREFVGTGDIFIDMNVKVYCNSDDTCFPNIFLIFVTDFLPMELINKAEFQNNTKSYIIHSMKVQQTERQQILQTTATDNNKVHILYPAPIFLLQNNVASPKLNFIILGHYFTDDPNYYDTTTLH